MILLQSSAPKPVLASLVKQQEKLRATSSNESTDSLGPILPPGQSKLVLKPQSIAPNDRINKNDKVYEINLVKPSDMKNKSKTPMAVLKPDSAQTNGGLALKPLVKTKPLMPKKAVTSAPPHPPAKPKLKPVAGKTSTDNFQVVNIETS